VNSIRNSEVLWVAKKAVKTREKRRTVRCRRPAKARRRSVVRRVRRTGQSKRKARAKPAAADQSLKPTALSRAQAARLLSAAAGPGGKVITEAAIAADIEAGAPTNPDGTINVVHYTAWLAREASA
jgi:hypothetical protein